MNSYRSGCGTTIPVVATAFFMDENSGGTEGIKAICKSFTLPSFMPDRLSVEQVDN